MSEADDEAATQPDAAALDPGALSGLPFDLFLFDKKTWTCVSVTDNARNACGFEADTLDGAALSWVFPELSAEDLTAHLERVAATPGEERFETMLRCASGGYRSVIARLSTLRIGAAGYLAVALEDAEPQRLISGALAQSEAVFRSILATAPDAIVVIDVDGAIVHASASAEQMFGYESGELTGRNVSVLAPAPHRERHDGYIARYLRTGEKRIIGLGRRVEGLRKDGSRFPAELAVGEAMIGDRRFFTGFVRNISLRVEAERRANTLQERLNQAGRVAAMGEMAATIAHELNQPLMAVVNYIQAGLRYQRNSDKSAEATQAFEKAVIQAKRASDVVHRARGFVSHVALAREPVDINGIVREAAELALLNAQSRHAIGEVELDFDLEEGLPSALADATQIQQVVVNLVKNALEALATIQGNAETPRVIVETRRVAMGGDRGHIAVIIQDNGPGIDEAELTRVFTPFVTTKIEGLGVGLSICRSIIDAHGGALRAERSPEGGAAFSFTLPASPTPEAGDGDGQPPADSGDA